MIVSQVVGGLGSDAYCSGCFGTKGSDSAIKLITYTYRSLGIIKCPLHQKLLKKALLDQETIEIASSIEN